MCAESVAPDSDGDTQDKLMRLLRLRLAYYQAKRGLGLRPLDIVMTDVVALGHLEDRPVDLSSLAEALMLPYPTVHRHAKDLIEAGWLVERKDGRRNCLYVNKAMLERLVPEINRVMARVRIEFD